MPELEVLSRIVEVDAVEVAQNYLTALHGVGAPSGLMPILLVCLTSALTIQKFQILLNTPAAGIPEAAWEWQKAIELEAVRLLLAKDSS